VTSALASNAIVSIGTIMAERLVYLPSLGFCWLVALGVRWLGRQPRIPALQSRAIAVVAIIAIVGLHGWRTALRNADWRTTESLFLHDVLVSPQSAKTQLNAGIAHQFAGRDAEAIEHYQRAIEIMDGRPTAARNNLGYLLVDREIDVRRGIGLLEQARQATPRDVALLDSLAWGYHKAGRHGKARGILLQAHSMPASPLEAKDLREHLEDVEDAMARRVGMTREQFLELEAAAR
jgi:tetratricopeptide (TPR) repeat protein